MSLFHRDGFLKRPYTEAELKAMAHELRRLKPNSRVVPLAEATIRQRFNQRG